MEIKRYHMERNILISEITEAPYNFKELAAGDFPKFTSFFQKYGQVYPIVVATVDETILIVDGQMQFEILKRTDAIMAKCYDLGVMTRKEYVTTRLFLSARNLRPNFLEVAKAINEIAGNERECQMLASRTHIPYEDVKRYKDLLTFDWDAFSREVPKPNLSLFE